MWVTSAPGTRSRPSTTSCRPPTCWSPARPWPPPPSSAWTSRPCWRPSTPPADAAARPRTSGPTSSCRAPSTRASPCGSCSRTCGSPWTWPSRRRPRPACQPPRSRSGPPPPRRCRPTPTTPRSPAGWIPRSAPRARERPGVRYGAMSQTGHSLLIGTYTETLPHVTGTAAGILGATYDPLTGSVRDVAVLARTRNPSYLAVGPDGRHVYAVNETHRFAGQPGGGVTAFARDPGTGALRELNFVSSGGEAPCFVSMDGRVVLVANYDSGSVTAIALDPDGSLGPGHATVQHAGSSVNAERQEGPHVHMAIPDPVTGDALVVDLGQDAVLTYQLGDSGLAERPGTRFVAP